MAWGPCPVENRTYASNKGENSIMKRNSLICAVAAVSVLASACHLAAGTYFVAPSGDDTNPGTDAAAFATILKAAEVVQGGDTVDRVPVHERPGLGFDDAAARIRRRGCGARVGPWQAPSGRPIGSRRRQRPGVGEHLVPVVALCRSAGCPRGPGIGVERVTAA